MSLVTMSREQFYAEITKRFGNDAKNWKFECPWCHYEQSMSSILEIIKNSGYHDSRRYGQITLKNIKELQPRPDQECLSPTCNFASYGLFGGSLEVDGHRYLNIAQVTTCFQGVRHE